MKTALWMAQQAGNGIDPKFFNQVAQFAHFGMMFTITTVVADIFERFGHGIFGMVVGVLGCGAYAVWHEFYWDPTHENVATRGSDLQDFSYLVFGSAAAVIAVWIRG